MLNQTSTEICFYRPPRIKHSLNIHFYCINADDSREELLWGRIETGGCDCDKTEKAGCLETLENRSSERQKDFLEDKRL